MTESNIPTIPEVPTLTDTRNTFMLATAASALDDNVLKALGGRLREIIKQAITGELPRDKEHLLVRVLFIADMIQLRTVRDEIVGVACDNGWLGSFSVFGRDLLIDLPEPHDKGSMSELRRQREALHAAITEAHKRTTTNLRRLAEREAAQAVVAEEADDSVASDLPDDVVVDATEVVADESETPVVTDDDEVAQEEDERELIDTSA